MSEMTKQEAINRMRGKERLMMTKWIDFPSLVGNPDVLHPSPNQAFSISGFERMQAIEKGRQEGQSMGYSIDSVLRAINEPGSNGVHVSTDKWESEKKQKYCLRVLDCMMASAKEGIRLVSEAKNHIEIEAVDQEGIRAISSIDFLACRPPRGADKAGVYLHEGAHMPNIIEILKAAKGCTAHAGYIRMCGTHQGSETEFYAIINNTEDDAGRRPHANWQVGHFPWWTFPGFCIDVELAIIEAWDMPTEDRVEKFGNWALRDLFASYGLEDFQEEFECIVLDARHSFYSDALIKSCQPQSEDAIKSFWFEAVTCKGSEVDGVQPAIELIDILANEIQTGRMPGTWLWSLDVGRKRDNSEITIGQKLGSGNILIPRMIISLDQIPFQKQEEVCRHLLNNLPVLKGFIDATGMGMMLAEVLHADYFQRAMPVTFTNALKSELANGLRIRMQKRGVIIPIFPPLTRQIHAIKKKVTLASNETYDVEANSKHHGDKFWSFALFCALEDPTGLETHTFMPEVIKREPDAFAGILQPGEAGYNTSIAPRPWDRGNNGYRTWRR